MYVGVCVCMGTFACVCAPEHVDVRVRGCFGVCVCVPVESAWTRAHMRLVRVCAQCFVNGTLLCEVDVDVHAHGRLQMHLSFCVDVT